MDAKALAVYAILMATASCQSNPETPKISTVDDKSFVPGVFIPADTLKSLQEKAKQPTTTEAQPELINMTKESDQISETLPDQQNQFYDPNQQTGNEQNNPLNQQQLYGDQSIMSGIPQANLPNQQPGYQQPGYQQPGYQQPGYQQPGYLQPGYQQPGFQQPGYPQPGYQQPGFQQPSYQQPGYQQPGYLQNGVAPYIPNQPTILLAQQPGYNTQGMPINQQPSYQQPMLGQQPSQQYFIPNGQMSQPTMPLQNQNTNNPAVGGLMTNIGQAPGAVYAMIPVNAQNANNALPDPNLNNNNNAYFLPVQQIPSNGVMLNNGK